MSELICVALIFIVVIVLGFIFYTGDKILTSVINYIKSFIRWHRKIDKLDDYDYYDKD